MRAETTLRWLAISIFCLAWATTLPPTANARATVATASAASRAATGAAAPAEVAVLAPPSAAAARQAGTVSMFLGEPRHRGVYDTNGVDTLSAVAWRFETGGPVRSSAAIFDGTLYVGSSDHNLYAVDAAAGAERWRFAAGAAVTSSPAVDDERVVFGDRAGDVFALSRRDGTLLWKVETGPEVPLPWGHEGWDYITASPTLIGGLVLIGSGDGNLYALDAADGSERWRFTAGARIRTTPAVADALVLFGDADGVFRALSVETGALVWRFDTAGHGLTSADVGFDRRQIYSSAAVHDDVVYFGSRDAQLYALDLRSGDELWRAGDGTSAWVISSPAVTDDRVFSARSSSTKVRALDVADGREIWSVTTGGGVFTSPVVVGGTVYVGNASGWVMAFAAEDGAERWRYRTGGGVWATPLVVDGRLYVGSDDGSLYALADNGAAQPRRAVFWEEESVSFSSMGMGPAQRRILAHFEYHGYETLSAQTLAGFLRDRIDDGVASVVVFAMDHLPADVLSEPLEDSLYRRYLARGGKIVWMGAPPGFYVFDGDSGQVTGIDAQRAGALLDMDLSDYRSDVYAVRPTEAGRRWGLRNGWVGAGGFAAGDVDEVLAVDELGRVVSWARNFGGARGTGFVFVRPATDAATLDEISAVAEYGVLRTP